MRSCAKNRLRGIQNTHIRDSPTVTPISTQKIHPELLKPKNRLF
jgi:hypothetical protein